MEGQSSSGMDSRPSRRTLAGRKKKGPVNELVADETIYGKIIATSAFENAALCVIVMNAAWIGVDLDYNGRPGVTPLLFVTWDNIFCVLFTTEIVIRVLAYRRMIHFFTDPILWKWNLFDLTLVLLMVVETWILPFLFEGEGQLSQLSMLRLLRLLRISRVFRMVPELGMMVKSMAAAARSVSSTLVLAIGIMYVFAILLTQWAKSGEAEGKFDYYFGTIPFSLMTLMQVMVYDDTFSLIRPCMEQSWYVGALLILFILIGSFTVLNMLIGVICEIVGDTTSQEKEKLLRIRVEEVFASIDEDESGTITRKEFGADAKRLLKRLGIDSHLLQNAFDIIDVDDSNSLDMNEFISMIFRLLHPPKTQDVLIIHRKIDRLAEQLGLPDLNQKQKKKGPTEGGGAPQRSPLASAKPTIAAQHAQRMQEQFLAELRKEATELSRTAARDAAQELASSSAREMAKDIAERDETERRVDKKRFGSQLATLEAAVARLERRIQRATMDGDGIDVAAEQVEPEDGEQGEAEEPFAAFVRQEMQRLSNQMARQASAIGRLEKHFAYAEGSWLCDGPSSSSSSRQGPR